jgi:3-isopropylmalate/(R)-2-methylmalate dehydratase large subunit
MQAARCCNSLGPAHKSAGLRMTRRKLLRPDRHLATVDRNVPRTSVEDQLFIADQTSAAEVNALQATA